MDGDEFFRLEDTKTLCPAHSATTDTRLIEVVKLLARIAAERDYTEYIKQRNEQD